jgi:hypothetical protein
MSAIPNIGHVDVNAAIHFLTLMTSPGVHMNLVAFDPADDKPVGAMAFSHETVNKTAKFITQHAHCNLYWSVNPLKTALNKKAMKGDVAGMMRGHLDRDDPSDHALAVIQQMNPPPTTIVFSGNGYHGFWQLDQMAPIENFVNLGQPGNVPALEETNCGLLVKAGEPDESTRNIDRIMRLPGTTNWPTKTKLAKGRVPIEARLIEHHPQRVYSLADLPKAKPKAGTAPTAEKTKTVDRSKELFNQIREVIFDSDGAILDEQIHADHADDPHVLSQAPARRHSTIQRCIDKARAHLAFNNDAIAAMNEKHAVLWVGNHMYVMWRTEWNGLMPRLASKADMKAYYSNAGKGANPFDLWMRWPDRAETEIVFEPGKATAAGEFNVWRGFGVAPKEGDCSLFLSMVLNVICSGDVALYKYVMAWCADGVQNPAHRPGVVLVLKGPPGTGKGTFANAIGTLFGHHYVYVSRAKHVTGNFNAHVANKLLMFADEAVFAGDKVNEGALKSMITEKYLPVELKGKDVIMVHNHLRIIMASNQDWVVPATIGDRRFAVIEVSALRMQDAKYFKAIHEQLDNGGYEALLHHLQRFDLTGIELRDLPKTDARLNQQLLSMSPIEKWWYGRLVSGAPSGARDEWLHEVHTKEMFVDYAEESGISGVRHRGTVTEFGIALHKLVPGLGKGKKGGTEPKNRTLRVNTYLLPSLADCREAFNQRLGGAVTWPKDDHAGGADRPPDEPEEL